MEEQPAENLTVPKPKIKYDWYQTENEVVLTILIKNVQKESVKVNYGDHNLSFETKLQNGNDYMLELDLAYAILPEYCNFKIFTTKVEIHLRKKEIIHWNVLEGTLKEEKVQPIPKHILEAGKSNNITTYPSSYVKKSIDWNKLEKEIEKEEEQDQSDINKLFQNIYKQGSDEVKKAMNKSFVESAGTVLSTNWKDVGSTQVECKAPDGVEFKKWNS